MIRVCSEARTVLIATHVNPDGDAVGSSLALAATLQKLDKQVVVYDPDPVPYMFRFLPGADLVVNTLPEHETFDLLILLDCSEPGRAGREMASFSGYRRTACIDHHITNDHFAQFNLIDPQASATAELVYEVVAALDADFSRDVAVNLYTAILTDTGSFHYENAGPRSFAVAGKLVAKGVDPWMVAQHVYESEPLNRLQLLAYTLQTLRISANGKAACVTVTREMYAKTGTNAEHTDRLVNYPRSIDGVEVAFMLRQTGERSYKLSFRSRGMVDVASLAQEFGGGGHKNAAGCHLDGSADDIIAMVFAKLDDLLEVTRGAGGFAAVSPKA
ncbi:MAG: bifunctional oligoribonuclease/PAP phosphatase NrnA [Deltaproteobacteria bacterium]|nr:bifunctional oligoribonuclease/PAP phosphatase NrnA [Candidatus Anaeroferrophillus wilburensis]MBN2888923.1 bifunctional oligoribonuclease/PAP phosphatase NrnA [Deltaproteobacteria bacterium]